MKAIWLCLAACGGATASAPQPTPVATKSAEPNWRAEIDRFARSWSYKSKLDGPVEQTETCRWIPEGTFVVCKTDKGKGFSMLGWEPHNQRYAYYGISGTGEVDVLTGTAAGNVMDFVAKNGKERVQLRFDDKGNFTFRAETLEDAGTWKVAVEGFYEIAAPTSSP
jgi:hypothetical protein